MKQQTAGVRVGTVSYGRGVFAARPFKNGELVGVVRGRVIDDVDYSSEFCIDLGGSLSLEPRAPFRYLNHCCTPNCQLWIVEGTNGASADLKVVIETVKPVRTGEELTIDYGWPAETAIPCRCRSRRCRGWIVAEEERHLVPPSRNGRQTADEPDASA